MLVRSEVWISGWDEELFAELLQVWTDRGYLNGGVVALDDLADVVSLVLATSAHVPTIALCPPCPPT